MKELVTEAKLDNLNTVLAFVDEQLEAIDCPMKLQMQIDLAVEETFVNVASYAYSDSGGGGDVSISVAGDKISKRVEIIFADRGIPFNPLAKEDPDVTLPAQERKIGGLGIFMVKKSMDTVQYEYKDGRNILKMSKNL